MSTAFARPNPLSTTWLAASESPAIPRTRMVRRNFTHPPTPVLDQSGEDRTLCVRLCMNLANISQSLKRPLNSRMAFAVVQESPIFPSLPPVLEVRPLPVPNPPPVELQPLALRVKMPPRPRLRLLSPPLPARPRPQLIPRQLMAQCFSKGKESVYLPVLSLVLHSYCRRPRPARLRIVASSCMMSE